MNDFILLDPLVFNPRQFLVHDKFQRRLSTECNTLFKGSNTGWNSYVFVHFQTFNSPMKVNLVSVHSLNTCLLVRANRGEFKHTPPSSLPNLSKSSKLHAFPTHFPWIYLFTAFKQLTMPFKTAVMYAGWLYATFKYFCCKYNSNRRFYRYPKSPVCSINFPQFCLLMGWRPANNSALIITMSP